MFRVRLRLPSAQETLVLEKPTIRSLLEAIQPFVNVKNLTGISARFVYPPKSVDFGSPTEWDNGLDSIGIKNGETLIIAMTQEQPRLPQGPLAPAAVEAPQEVWRAPLAGPSRAKTPEAEQVPVGGGTVVLRVMADDNSCLYFPSPSSRLIQV